MVKQARRQADHYHGLARRAASARACPRDGEDPDGGLHLHSTSYPLIHAASFKTLM
jgi:hypothetical protein